MEECHQEFHGLLERARNGCQLAAAELVEKYSRPLRMVIRRHLAHRARSRLDSVDLL
jgi:hypothetical protein